MPFSPPETGDVDISDHSDIMLADVDLGCDGTDTTILSIFKWHHFRPKDGESSLQCNSEQCRISVSSGGNFIQTEAFNTPMIAIQQSIA